MLHLKLSHYTCVLYVSVTSITTYTAVYSCMLYKYSNIQTIILLLEVTPEHTLHRRVKEYITHDQLSYVPQIFGEDQ